MSDHTAEVVTGSVVLAAAVGFLVYAVQMTGVGQDTGDYELSASFRSAEGVTVGSDVRLAGVKIGTVTALDLNPQTFRADAVVSVVDGVEIPDDSAIVIASEGLLGGTFVEIVPGGSPFNFEPGAEIEDTQGAVSLVTLLMRFVAGDDAP